jgi:hypothetical protein
MHIHKISCYINCSNHKYRHGFGPIGKMLFEHSIIDDLCNINLKRAEGFVNNFNWICKM